MLKNMVVNIHDFISDRTVIDHPLLLNHKSMCISRKPLHIALNSSKGSSKSLDRIILPLANPKSRCLEFRFCHGFLFKNSTKSAISALNVFGKELILFLMMYFWSCRKFQYIPILTK